MIGIDEGKKNLSYLLLIDYSMSFIDEMFSLENLLLTVEEQAKEVPLKQQIESQTATLTDLKSKVK